MIKKTLLHRLAPLLGVILFSVALWLLHRELRNFHYRDVLAYLHGLPSSRILMALGLTAASYLVLTGYDFLAVRHLGKVVPYWKTALASFIGYSFSNSLGNPIVTSTPIRVRYYSAWGLSALEVAKVIGFCFLTFWLGFCTLGGATFVLAPVELPDKWRAPFSSLSAFGVLLLLIPLFYLGASIVRRRPVRVGTWEVNFPTPTTAVAQIAISSLDWLLAASVLYSLLPSGTHLSLPTFLSGFLLAQVAGLISLVPGGLGIFESVIVLVFAPQIPAPVLVGTLLAYRGVYYLLPLSTASMVLVVLEVLERRERFGRLLRGFGEILPSIVPQVIALTTFLGGTILLFSGATPARHSRLAWLNAFLPLPIIEASHFLGSLAGVGLLFLARGLQRRLDGAYHLATLLLAGGIVVSLLKGLDYEEAVALAIMLLALILSRQQFYRKASILTQLPTPGWLAAIAIVLIGSTWLGLFSYKNIQYSNDLWWHFTLFGNAPRFLRATVAAFAAAVFLATARLLRPASPGPTLPSDQELHTVRKILTSFPRTYAHLALLGDKELLFNDAKTSFVMFGIEGRSWVAMGDPVAPFAEMPELIFRFREVCDRYGAWSVFYQVRHETLHLYVDLGLTLLKLGEEGRVSLPSFSLEGGGRKALRNVCNRMDKEGATFEVVPAAAVEPIMPELERISTSWLQEKKTGEKGFSMGFFETEYLRHLPLGLIRQEGRLVGFANLWLGGKREELSVDLMRYLPDAPPGVMDYLFVKLMQWGRDAGYHWFNLGMAPLAGLDEGTGSTVWSRLARLVYRHGEHFYNFRGLRQYKNKFDPVWEARYLASPGGLVLPQILTNIATLIGGGLRGVVTNR